MDNKHSNLHNTTVPELYFLISKFLSVGPLQDTAAVLIKELERKKVLPKRIDWEGNEHDQNFIELEKKYPHIKQSHLLEICCRIGPILDKELPPSVTGVISLLGSGKQSLLRTKDNIYRPRTLLDYYTRFNGITIPDEENTNPTHNLLKVLMGRESCGPPVKRQLLIPTSFYSKTRLLRRTLGHLSAVYCVLFDRSGRYIITGADDLLVKLWSALDGRLLATFRGASAEITDIAINLDNTLLAAGSLDRVLRVWDLQTTAPIAILTGHTGMITSVNFCPSPRGDLKYLVTTSTDGSVAFWQYTTPRGTKTVFASKPIQYHEKLRPGQAQMICASFSPGGIFLAAGSADHHVRVYIMQEEGPKRILETESHTDAVDSIQWAHKGLRFISGSKDGTAHVWTFESQQWKSLKLNMSEKLSSCPEPSDESKKVKVTMVAWDYSDKWVITAVNDYTVKVWEAKTGRLHKVLRGHKDELYVLESHPRDEHVLLSAGHDGQIFLWDINAGISLAHFANNIDGQGHGGVFDAKWSPDGTMVAATDSHGHILMFGFGAGHQRFKTLPQELFFHTDYRPLLRDVDNLVVDEQTQMMPHLMPPPFLVDVDGNPHPPIFQRLVPGRENCPTEQLIPNIAVGPEGVEVIDGNSTSHIDRLIEALANRHGQDPTPDSNNDRSNQNNINNLANNLRNNVSSNRVGLRRTGDVEGVRQSSGNWQRESSYKWIRRIYVRPMKYAHLQAIKQVVYGAGQDEQDCYRREMRRRPIMINTLNTNTALQISNRFRGTRNARRGRRPAYHTRAVREREHIEEEHDVDEDEESGSNTSGDSSLSTAVNEEELSQSSSSDTESSDYSDWVVDTPGPNLEPPKRSKRKRVVRRTFSGSSDGSQTGTKVNVKKKIPQHAESGEIPEAYKPPEWLSEVIPRKAPYYPQMGDEIVYLRQGHQRYLEAARLKKVYKIASNAEPWISLELKDHEIVRVIGIKYEIRPPRLCCLKLALVDNDGKMTNKTFTIKYHDMPDVLDFLVLRQTYETAVRRNWGPGDRFRCMIDDGWWMGQIESRIALSAQFPDSLFMCFRVRWDNGEYEYMSPWDMEPIDENRLPSEVGGAVRVLPEEIRATLYQPVNEEWPRGDRDASCRRIINGLEQVMGLAIADPFLAPVDLNIYPAYAYVVEYPIDLTTIKARFENHFYRRITSAQFDVRYLATNAEKFNQCHSNIVKHARIVTDLCLRIIRDPNDVDVGAVYHQLVATYISSDSENDINEPVPSTSTAPPLVNKRKSISRRSKRIRSQTDWRQDCRELLDLLWQCDDSSPFREPVDTLEHPDYIQIVDTPMDLRTIKEDLLGGNYTTPLEFAKDVRLIFQNSRNYNTNKRSRIYSMTLRLSTLFETHIKEAIYNWKASRRRLNKNKASGSAPDHIRPKSSRKRTRGPTINGNINSTHSINSSENSDDDDDNRGQGPSIMRTRAKRIIRNVVSSTNDISSTIPREPIPGPSGRCNRPRASRPNSQEEADTEYSSTNSSSSSSTDDDSEESRGIALADLGNGTKVKKINKNRSNDSEDSYKPNERPKRKPISKKRKKTRKDIITNGRIIKKRRILHKRVNGKPVKIKRITKFRKRKSVRKINHRREGDNSTDKSNSSEKPKKSRTVSKTNGNIKKTRYNHEENSQQMEEQNEQRVRTSRRLESDHSYHLPARNSRRNTAESETEQESIRPRRSTARRNNIEYNSQNSIEEDGEEDETLNNILRKKSSRKLTQKRSYESENGQDRQSLPSTSRQQDPRQFRQVRTNRNSRVILEEDTDEEPLVRTQNIINNTQRIRPSRTLGEIRMQNGRPTLRRQHSDNQLNTNNGTISTTTNSTISSRRAETHIPGRSSTSAFTRSQANTTHINTISSSSNIRTSQFRSHVQVDHNYGEPGPSSMRHTRRMLSRHQRNADELDPLYAESTLDIPLSVAIRESISSRLRVRNLNNNNNNVTSTRNIVETSERHLRGRRSRNYTSDNIVDNLNETDNDDTDSSDNRPLTYITTKSTRNFHEAPTSTQSRALRNKRYITDEEYENDVNGYNRSSRSKRNQKRPRYNEDTDDSSDHPIRKRRTGMRSSPSSPPNRYRNNSGTNQRNINNEEIMDSDNEQQVSISSRGRVRKITAKARGLFRE